MGAREDCMGVVEGESSAELDGAAEEEPPVPTALFCP